MEVIVKEGTQRIDPKHPESHPGYEKAVEVAKKKYPKMKFESEGQKKDYLRAVNANPNNLPGLPAFYPPLSMGLFSGFRGIDGEKKDMLPCGKTWVKATYGENGVATYRCRGCNCEGFGAEALT